MKTSRLALAANPGGALHPGRSVTPVLRARSHPASPAGRFFRAIAIIALIWLHPTSQAAAAIAPPLTLAWDANTDADLAGYEISYGTSPGAYTTTVDVGKNTTTTISGLIEGGTYFFTVSAYSTAGLKSPPAPEISHTLAVTPRNSIPPSTWLLKSTDSQETPSYAASMAFDGNPATFWHTSWSTTGTTGTTLPHELQIDLRTARIVNGFSYLPRQDGYPVGNIGRYEFYVSTDGVTWGEPVASGTFANSAAEKEVFFTPATARYVRLKSLTSANSDVHTSVAELRLFTPQSETPPSPPVATAQSVTTPEDTRLAITLSGTSALNYVVTTAPSKGTLSGTAPNLIYTPAANISGTDSFAFKVNDGTTDSAPATISINITAVNDAPVAVSKSATTNEDTPVAITLAGSDIDNSTLTYTVVSSPGKGTLSGTAPNLVYTPAANVYGADSFTFKVSDGASDSPPATVSISISAVNDVPLAASKSVNTPGNTPVEIILSGGDIENTPLTIIAVSTPANGSLSGTPPFLTYTPAIGFSGTDRFSYQTHDGTAASAVATISIRVAPVVDVPGNFPPVFGPDAIRISATEDAAISGHIIATDQNSGDILTYRKISGPAWLTLSSTGELGGTPLNADVGENTFTLLATDPANAVASATLVVTVFNANDPPVFKSTTFTFPSGSENSAYLGQTLSGLASDPDRRDPLTYSKVSGPSWLVISAAGTLGGTPPAGSSGTAKFRIRATDAAGAFAEADLRIEILENSLPLPWNVDRLGRNNLTGGARYSAGSFTVIGSGRSTDTTDAANFGWQTLSGDGKITARVRRLDKKSPSALVGVMIRESLASNSRQVFLGTSQDADYRWFRRGKAGAAALRKTVKNPHPGSLWLRLVREGDTFSAYSGKDGVEWTRIGRTTIQLPKNCYIGLSVSSGDDEFLTSSTFSNVSVTP